MQDIGFVSFVFFFALWIIITSNWNMIVRVHVVQT